MNNVIVERICDLINDINYEPLTIESIKKEIETDETFDINEVKDALDFLVKNYKLFISKKGKYKNNKQENKYIGVISIRNEDFGFVTNPYSDDIYVDSYFFNDAMDKDEVLYSINFDIFGRNEAKVIAILKRHTEFLVGEVIYKNGRTYLEVSDKYLFKTCIINGLGKAKVGDVVRAKITSYGYNLKLNVVEVLGRNTSLGIDITSVLAKLNIPYVFPDDVLLSSKELIDDALEKDYEIFNKDLIFTIDGDDAKDLDDAVSISFGNGNYNVGIYIADVSHYVKEHSLIDDEALKRGTSIYLVDRVVPMLPERLSNDLCSLNPNQNKLVMALFMEIDSFGNVIKYEIKEGIIKTSKRLSYSKCNDVLENGLVNNPDYEVCYNSLVLMLELSKILKNKRNKRGSIDFNIDEAKVIVDEKGKAIDIVLRERGISESIIEELMILANETVCEIVSSLDLPFIYRVHEKPDMAKYYTLKTLLNKLGYSIKSMHPKEIQKILNEICEKDSFLKTEVLRMMNKAIYSNTNIGHFGLASKCYTHFTSPIRRYPDLIVHRLLRKYIIDGNYVISNEEYTKLDEKIDEYAKMNSMSEKRAIECEYKVLDMKKAEYMEKFLDVEFEGTISSIHRFGIFVVLPNTVEGLISLRNLEKKGFKYNRQTNTFICKSTISIELGDKLKVKLIKTSKKNGDIDFDLVYNNRNEKRGRSKKNVKRNRK